jgi:hypothetical protein
VAPALQTETGQATVESLTAIVVLTALLGVGLFVSYLCFAHVWLDHCSYEALICLSTSAPQSRCQEQMKIKIKTALPVGQIETLHLQRSPSLVQTEVSLAISGKQVLEHRASLPVPLKSQLTH